MQTTALTSAAYTTTMGRTSTLVDVEAWGRWRTSRSGRHRWQRWAAAEPALLGWTTDDLANPISSQRTDAMQAALVGLAQRGEGDAATTILVQLRPGLVRLVRWAAAGGHLPWHDAVDEVRAVFFETLYRHSLERRPNKIAANLLLDTRQRLLRSQPRMPEPGWSGPQLDTGEVDPLSRLLVTQVLRAGLEQLPGSERSRALTAAIAYRAWVLDQSRSDIATELGVGRETVTTRLHRLRRTIPRDRSLL